MKIFHHIGVKPTEQTKAAFAEAGVELQPGLMSGFDISEDDPRWEMVSKLVARFRTIDLESTEFSPSELDAAKYLVVKPAWYHGYPEPAEDFGFLQATFDTSAYCEECGIGLKQIAPFRMKKAPAWGRRAILMLNWIYDEYFVTPEAWAAVFKPFGIGCRPVLLNRTGAVLDSVVQLDIQTLVDIQRLEERPFLVCAHCGRKKYRAVIRGFSPAPVETDVPMFKSSPYFGVENATANKMVIISNALYRKIQEASLKGAKFLACAES